MKSKQMQTYSIIWNYSSYQSGVFLCKNSPCTKHKWHCTIGFLILFFLKEYILFLNVYVSVNRIFKCYLLFGLEIGHPLSMCATEGMEGSHPKWVQVHIGGEEYHSSYSFHVFVLRCLLLTRIKMGCFCIYSNLHKNRHLIFLKESLTQMFV